MFRVLERGHVQIVDRVKDIYKNSHGQTVAPRRVEDQFSDVPGIRRTFLVGDHRPWNALLVVPDLEDPLLKDAPDEHSRHEYFGHVIAAANQRLVPFERVVNYVLLDRDFEAERGELTAKGSFKRKIIQENFADAIEELYRHPYLERVVDGLTLRIPQWLARDLGALEADIIASDHALIDETRELSLRICRLEDHRVQVGDLIYRVAGDLVDLGRLSRQPELWMGNTELLAFVPCKDGWDVPFGDFEETVALPPGAVPDEAFTPVRASEGIDGLLLECNDLVQMALHAPTEPASIALEELARRLGNTDRRLDHAIRQRLTMLALHDDSTRRCEAYRVLLMDEPTARYNEAFGPFVDSGRPFLNASTIHRIAAERFGRRRLEALRQRLAENRGNGEWPASKVVRAQFQDVLRLLVEFAREHPENYHPVRCELASWVVHRDDPELAHRASELLTELVKGFESALLDRLGDIENLRADQLVFDDDIIESAREQQRQLLASPAFLVQSIQLAYNEPNFDPRDIVEGGLWISSRGPHDESGGTFRWSIHTERGRHYQLLVIARKDLAAARVLETNYRMLAIGGHPFGERVLPRFGCARPDLGAMSLEFIDDLSVEERIRRAVGAARSGGEILGTLDWRHLYIRGMGAVISTWQNSGRRLVPPLARPSNVVVPAIDFREGARVLTLSGWQDYERPADLLVPLWAGFYPRVFAHHPECREWVDPAWIGDAIAEAIGAQGALELIGEAVAGCDLPLALRATLEGVLDRGALENHVPLVIELATGRFHTWQAANPDATLEARTSQVDAMIRLYAIARLGEAARAELFRHTVFADAPEASQIAFDQLLAALRSRPGLSVTQRVELSELQATLDDEHRQALSRMVFPHSRQRGGVEVLTFGEPGHEHVTVGTNIVDRTGRGYQVREPIGAEEVGQVYRLFYREHFARAASEADRFLVTLDRDQRVVAALIYREESDEVTHIDGFVVRSSMSGRGIASALLEDFCARAEGRGRRVVKTSFILREFCERRGFRVDRRWGGLVRFLESAEVESTS